MTRPLPSLLSATLLLSACGTKDVINDGIPVEVGNGGAGGAAAARGGAGGARAGTGGRGGTPGTGGMAAGGAAPAPGGAGGALTATDASIDVIAPVEAGAVTASFKVNGVATWKGNAAGAYSIVHEVVCDPSVTNGPFMQADPELKKRDLRGGFAVIVNLCESGRHWEKVKTLVANGHDVFSHTFNHRCLTNNNTLAQGCDGAVMRSTDYATEIDRAAMMLDERTGVKPGFLLFPFDVCDPAAVTRAKARGYIGARCAQGMNTSDFADSFNVAFDLWGPGWSRYRTMGNQCMGLAARARPNQASAACRQHVLSKYVEDAIASKGWALRGFHGFDTDNGSFEPVSAADYRAHLDFLVTKVTAGQLWVDGPGRVVRYRMARQHCPSPTLEGTALKFAAPSAECTKHATDVSYLVGTSDGSDPASLAVSQAGQRIAGKKVGAGSFVIDLDPTKGDATIVD